LNTVISLAEQYNPLSIEVACMLDKQERRAEGLEERKPDYCGFLVPDAFVVGYGMDFNDNYRALNHLCVLKDHVHEMD